MSNNSDGPAEVIVDSRGRPISQEVADELDTAGLRIKPAAVAERMWQRLFTNEDRQRLGGNIKACWPELGTARMWMQARGVSVEHAVIDVAHGLDLMSDATARWLKRELDLESTEPKPPGGRPVWRPDKGELCLENQIIRRVRVLREPSNIHKLLDAFQTADWPGRVKNPLSGGQQQLHETLRSLKRGLKAICFRAQEGGAAITWERR